MTIRTFFAIVERTDRWDKSLPAHEQTGFAAHAAYMHALEAEGFIALAGLLEDSKDVVFLFHAADMEQVRKRLSEDPWQKDGHARLVRIEEIQIRTGAPQPRIPS